MVFVCNYYYDDDKIMFTQSFAEIRGLSDAKIQKILEAARKLCPSSQGFITAKECEAQRDQMIGTPLVD